MKIYISFIVIFLSVSFTAYAEEQTNALSKKQKDAAVKEDKCARIGNIHDYFLGEEADKEKLKNIKPNTYEAYKLAFDLVDGIADTTRDDQTRMLDLARSLNGLLFILKETKEVRKFKNKMFKNTAELSVQSRRDSYFMNSNISRLIRCEGPNLLQDLAELDTLLNEEDARTTEIEDRINVFSADLNELTHKFTNSREFYIGVGASYAYFPQIFSRSNYKFDLTPFDGALGNNGESALTNSGTLSTRTEFANISYPAMRLTADMPLVDIDLMIGTTDETIINDTAIRATPTGIERQSLLYKTNIKTTLKLDYDVQARLSIIESINFFEKWKKDELNSLYYRTKLDALTAQLDLGLGVGTSGFKIKNDLNTEFRFKTENDVLFSELPLHETLNQKSESSFNVFYWNLYATFEISDQLMASLEYRFYSDETKNNNSLIIDGDTLSFSVVFFVL